MVEIEHLQRVQLSKVVQCGGIILERLTMCSDVSRSLGDVDSRSLSKSGTL
jgi:hypothetical protein